MIFIDSEINNIDLDVLLFKIFKILAVKIRFSGKTCFASKILPHVNTVFYRDHSF